MSYFRKKPVVVEARQFDGSSESGKSIEQWVGDNGGDISFDATRKGLAIATLEGVMVALEGDWVIRGLKGEFYPCKPDIFAATYEPVEQVEVTQIR